MNFEGDVPVDPSQVYGLLMEALSEQSRVIVGFEVDGKDVLQEEELPSAFEKIEAKSITHDELTFRLTIETMNKLSGTEEQIEAYVRNVLILPWSEVFGRMNELIEKIQPFADIMDNLGPYVDAYAPPWGKELKESAESQTDCLGKILSAFEQGNPAGLSDALHLDFVPIFKRSRKLFSETIIPYLKERVEAQ